jgi:16S rRNA (adenine1518-N6/adenine1519-N6)-dimethyltransferase
MAQTKGQIQSFLAAANTQPRHRFGQNFMIDANMVRAIADAGEITESDVVIEVGPGTGTLTEELLLRAGRVIAVEIDRDLSQMLLQRFAENPKFELIEGDALDGKHALNPTLVEVVRVAKNSAKPQAVKLVANLPYNIASPLVIGLLLEGIDRLVFTVQKEVADRLKGEAGTNDFGPLTVMAQMLAKVEVLRTLPNTVFWPPPKIESALVRMDRHDQLGESARDFSKFVAALFSFRRKTLSKALSMMEVEIEPTVLAGKEKLRAEDFTPAAILELYRSRIDRSDP